MYLQAMNVQRSSGKAESAPVMIYVVNSSRLPANHAGGVLFDFLFHLVFHDSWLLITISAFTSSWYNEVRISANRVVNIGNRAMMMNFQPGCSRGRYGRMASRIKRLARFLCTAPPSERPAVTPIRVLCPSAGITTNTKSG